jgi:50S ribosomal subunit-associated GTPase HflX
MADLLADRVSKVELALPLSRTDLLSLLHRTGHVLSASYENSHVIVVASVSPKVYARVEPFLIRREPELQPA